MKTLFALVALFALTSSASAALPPFYQSARELRAILDSPEVAQSLGSGRQISSIVRNDGGRTTSYDVTTSECTLNVEIHYMPPVGGIAGPARFELEVGIAACLPR